MTWVRETGDGVVLSVRVVPRASGNRVEGLHGDALKIRLQAPPLDGRANRLLVKFLAGLLDMPAGRVLLASGETSRNKRVLIRGSTKAVVLQRLGLPDAAAGAPAPSGERSPACSS